MTDLVELAARAHYEESGADKPAWDKLEFWRPHSINMMKAAFAALNAAGYKIVAREPTEEMLSAWGKSMGDGSTAQWQTMWDAAP